MQNNQENLIAIDPSKYDSLREYCEEMNVSIESAVDEAIEDFLMTSAAARLDTIRATRGARNVLPFPAVQIPQWSEPN